MKEFFQGLGLGGVAAYFQELAARFRKKPTPETKSEPVPAKPPVKKKTYDAILEDQKDWLSAQDIYLSNEVSGTQDINFNPIFQWEPVNKRDHMRPGDRGDSAYWDTHPPKKEPEPKPVPKPKYPRTEKALTKIQLKIIRLRGKLPKV